MFAGGKDLIMANRNETAQSKKTLSFSPICIESGALLVLLGGWIVVVHHLFTVNKFTIDQEIEVQRKNSSEIHPYYQQLKRQCGDVIFSMTEKNVDKSFKHNYFASHFSDILIAGDSMVNITTNMNRSIFSTKEYEKLIVNNAAIVVTSDFLRDIHNPMNLGEAEIEQQLRVRFWKYIFDAGLKEENIRNTEVIDKLFKQFASTKLMVRSEIEENELMLDTLGREIYHFKETTGMDVFPILKIMENMRNNQIQVLIEGACLIGIINPMSNNLDMINAKMQPESRQYMKVPLIDAYIPHDVLGKLFFSFFIYIVLGGFIWKVLKRATVK